MPLDKSPAHRSVEEQQPGPAIDEKTELECTQDFIENELLTELKSSCEELDPIGAVDLLPMSEPDDVIKPVLQFNLGDSASELKLNTSSTTVLCNSSISEEDSGFLSSEAIIAMRESDSGLLDSVRFADADDDSIAEEKIEQNLTEKNVASAYSKLIRITLLEFSSVKMSHFCCLSGSNQFVLHRFIVFQNL